MANVLFKMGLQANLANASINPGTLYVTTDERAMYLDVNDSTRIRLGDFIEYDNWAAISALPGDSVSTSALYYAKAENILAKYNGSGWVQINPDNYVYTDSLTVGATGGTNLATLETSIVQKDESGNTYSTKTDSIGIVGDGATTVSVNADGQIVITSVDNNTDTTVDSAENHYIPVVDADSKLTADSGNVITGVQRDTRGHVTGIEQSAQNDVSSNVISVAGTEGAATVTSAVSTSAGTTKEASFKIVAGNADDNALTISTDAVNKTITLNAPDTRVTSVENHYVPEGGTEKKGTGKFITGITVDAAGHITAVAGEDANFETVRSVTSKFTADDENGEIDFNIGVTHGGETKESTVSFKAGNNVTLSTANNIMTINADGVSGVGTHYKPTGAINGTHIATGGNETNALATTQVITGVTTDAAGHVTGVTSAGVKDTHANLKNLTIADNTKEGNGFVVTIEDTDNSTVTANFDPVIKIGSTDTPVHAVGGAFDLNVYTADEVDNKISTAIAASKAIVLQGEVGEDGTLPTENIQAGDAYLVTAPGIVAGKYVEIGDMFVAKEDAVASTDDNWYYIPAGDDATTLVYDAEAKAIQLRKGTMDNAYAVMGEIKFKDANGINPVIETETVGTYERQTISFEMTWGTF